jgi:hypothetical protein
LHRCRHLFRSKGAVKRSRHGPLHSAKDDALEFAVAFAGAADVAAFKQRLDFVHGVAYRTP